MPTARVPKLQLQEFVDAPEKLIPEKEMDRLRVAIRRGRREDLVKQILPPHPTQVLKDTLEQEKIRTAITMQVAIQEKMLYALSGYMEVVGGLTLALQRKMAEGAFENTKPMDLVKMAEKLKKALEPALDLASANVKLVPGKDMSQSVTANTVNIIYQMAHAQREAEEAEKAEATEIQPDPE